MLAFEYLGCCYEVIHRNDKYLDRVQASTGVAGSFNKSKAEHTSDMDISR
jgi:hypothetical protein